MTENVSALHILPQNFAPTKMDLWRWRHIVRRSSSRRTLTLLKRIEVERAHLADARAIVLTNRTWLLRYRADLRWAIDHSLVEPIKLYLADCPQEMVPLSVWLWSKCADRFRLYGLSAFCHDPSPQVRRHVAKALRRLEAWALLREMAEANPDDARIQWYATAPTTHRSFAERLKNYTESVDHSHAGEVITPSRMPFWSLERAWERTPPKSIMLVRRILRRIRHWVRWGVS